MRADRALDLLDQGLCRIGLRRFARWDDALKSAPFRLYASQLTHGLHQYATHWGITPYNPSGRNIRFDVWKRYPIPDDSVDSYQSEDVFEHLEEDAFVPLLDEIHRVLKPGGLFRLSLPDYRCDLYRERTRY